jgi:hypothetical protein
LYGQPPDCLKFSKNENEGIYRLTVFSFRVNFNNFERRNLFSFFAVLSCGGRSAVISKKLLRLRKTTMNNLLKITSKMLQITLKNTMKNFAKMLNVKIGGGGGIG